jgi:hypothetical protein
MERDYARLSLLAGYFAAMADHCLGKVYYGPLVRQHQWELTPEHLATWKNDAVRQGVPIEYFDLTGEQMELLEQFVDLGLEIQGIVDKRGA